MAFAALAAKAEGAPPVAPWAPDLVRKLAADADIKTFYKICPADVAGTRASRRTVVDKSLTAEFCLAKPEVCLDQCRGQKSAEACFELGLALQRGEYAIPPRLAEGFFALACAMGSAGGCTNRGGGLRNGGYDDDPFRGRPAAARNCEYRTFRYSCRHGDAWGCAMFGQALLKGEGVAKNVAQARMAFDKACGIDPKFAACDFAKGFAPR